jgi:predicted transglutaminase-like cysteine proteinase
LHFAPFYCRRSTAGLRATITALALVAGALIAAEGTVELSEPVIASAERKYGPPARARLNNWVQLIGNAANKKKTDPDKLKLANDFFNQIPFDADIEHWGMPDYWATPVEMLASHGGDCEDYAIGKYFTLLALGVSIDKLRITYVKAPNAPNPADQAHMVLTYYAKPDAMPLVLDNLKPDILPADKRTDLLPVYSFNGDGLWLAKERGAGRVGGSEKISLWTQLNSRMGKPLT